MTRMTTEWKNREFVGPALKGNKVLVTCSAPDETMRRVCEDQWAAQLGTRGVPAVRAYDLSGTQPAAQVTADEATALARSSGAVAVATTQLSVGDVAVVSSGPQVGIGVGGGSYGGAAGVGITFPVGGASASRGLASGTTLFDAASGTMVWSGTANTPASNDVTRQVSALTQITIEALQKAGVL
jgi:hypothetical protein